MMADAFCAMCAAYNWIDCLMRFCYSGFGGVSIAGYAGYGPGVAASYYGYGSDVASYYKQYNRGLGAIGTKLLWTYS